MQIVTVADMVEKAALEKHYFYRFKKINYQRTIYEISVSPIFNLLYHHKHVSTYLDVSASQGHKIAR